MRKDTITKRASYYVCGMALMMVFSSLLHGADDKADFMKRYAAWQKEQEKQTVLKEAREKEGAAVAADPRALFEKQRQELLEKEKRKAEQSVKDEQAAWQKYGLNLG